MSNKTSESTIEDGHNDPLAAWFLGPKAEHAGIWGEMIDYIFQDYVHWRRNYFPDDPIIVNRITRRSHDHWFDKLTTEVDAVLNQLKSHFPFFSPRYAAHMLSEQTLPSVLGYFAGMLYNPNNVTYEAAPITVPLELEVGKMVAEMLGYNPHTAWAHITSGGTIANTEALWVARTAQFNPLMVWEFCMREDIGYQIKTPNGDNIDIREMDFPGLISLKPWDAIFMVRRLASYLKDSTPELAAERLARLNQFFRQSRFNINNTGLHNILKEIGMQPRIYVSEAAHYSIKKAANLLGYGENSVVLVPVDSHFRMNTTALREMLENQPPEYYTACVIATAGTTEEGAVDPIHEIKFIRDDFHSDHNRSFWIHVDAAWGGYFRSLFSHPDLKDKSGHGHLDEVCNRYIEVLNVAEEFPVRIMGHDTGIRSTIRWDDPGLYKAFLAMPDADSITIDPHKMGYIPYPCGIVAFKNGVVTELIAQKAPYISDEQKGVRPINEPGEIDAIGPYILEGSKPGAAAAAAWLAHKTIPLETFGHGKIIRTSLLNARKFSKYLNLHRSLFKKIEELIYGKDAFCEFPFTFRLVYDPSDTNVVCFVVVPLQWHDGALQEKTVSLAALNQLNETLYGRLTIKSHSPKKTPHALEYFVSKTWIDSSQYAPESIERLLHRFNISREQYLDKGIMVLRSTLMNPWYFTAERAGMDYLMDFLLTMHRYTRDILNEE